MDELVLKDSWRWRSPLLPDASPLALAWGSMSRLWPQGQPINMQTDDGGRPLRFSWQNRVHSLLQIQQHWQVDTDWWSDEGRLWRDYLAVTTTNGLLCVVYRDLLSGEWYLSKVYD